MATISSVNSGAEILTPLTATPTATSAETIALTSDYSGDLALEADALYGAFSRPPDSDPIKKKVASAEVKTMINRNL